jgi:hypothetical protein
MSKPFGGIRASKFRKRMRERLIDGCDVMVISNPIPTHHDDYNVVRFVFKYKGSALIDFPQRKPTDLDKYYFPYSVYGCTTLCALLMIDSYFAKKHDVTFNMDARSFFLEAYKADKERRDPGWWNRRDEHDHFLATMADDLFLLLKVCDKRTGKRSLTKLQKAGNLPLSVEQIISDRLRG